MVKLLTLLCFSIIVGRGASSDGSLLLGHNEDDKGTAEYYLNSTPQGLWAEVPGFKAADSFLNRWGVAIVSDNCKSREDREDYTAGGVLYDLRYSVFEFAHSAREASTSSDASWRAAAIATADARIWWPMHAKPGSWPWYAVATGLRREFPTTQ